MTADGSAFKEYKTGQSRWTQKKVDDNGQITFYAMAIMLKTGKIPQDIELVHIETIKRPNGPIDSKIEATGAIYRYPTTRKMIDILKMMDRVKKAWTKMQSITAEELL